jgi:hypothetical protein
MQYGRIQTLSNRNLWQTSLISHVLPTSFEQLPSQAQLCPTNHHEFPKEQFLNSDHNLFGRGRAVLCNNAIFNFGM